MKSSAASSTRFAYIDALKILSMYAVVLLHTSAMGTYDVQGSSWHGFILLNAATRFAVPLFVMCSGAMLLQPASSAEHPLHFLRRRFLRVLLPFLVWSLAYEAQAIYLGAAKDLAAILLDFLYLTVRYHLWFVYMILALYLLTPLLRSALAALKTRELHYGMMIWLFFSLLVSVEYLTTADYWHTGTIFFFPEFVGYFIAGWILHTGRLMEKRISWLALPASVAAIIATAAYLVIHTEAFA